MTVQGFVEQAAQGASMHAATVDVCQAREDSARAALTAASVAKAEAQAAKAAYGKPIEALARALAWAPRDQIERHQGRNTGYTSDGKHANEGWRTAFAHGRLTTEPSWNNRNAAPRARAHVWLGTSSNGPDFAAGTSGTRDPEKLAAQVSVAREWLLDTLSQHSARAWLRARDIDPETAPRLADVAVCIAGAEWHRGGWSYPGFWHPSWTLMLYGEPIASIDNARDLLTPEEPGRDQDTILGVYPTCSEHDDEAGKAAVRQWAELHTARALVALVSRFEPREE